MSNDRSDDAGLVAGVLAEDDAALESIYRKYGGAVHFVARKVLRDDALAEDVVQDVFVSFWNSPDGFDPDRGSLRTYLLTIAHRRAVDIVRSEAARSRREGTSPLGDQVIDIDDEVWARSQSEIVRNAVAQLSEDERNAISLAYFKGLTYVEVAKALAEPEGTVKSRIRGGMRKLSLVLAEVAR
ncbi:MAG TPA: sigma-70 family RNA polymerase sigma factor [Acidimicrobiia bacterium]|nr:sigma-70 family RNA polymerase sigma factor [Acidimicrobiia bacterium]